MEVYERTWRQIVTEGREQNEVVSLKEKLQNIYSNEKNIIGIFKV